MDKRATLNLVLLAVVAALGALIWQARERPAADADHPPMFSGLDQATGIAVMELGTADGAPRPRWAIEKRDGAWRLTAPFSAPADAIAVEELLRQLGELRSRARYAANELDLAAAGLTEPSSALVVTRADGETRYALGGTESLNYRRYLQVGDAVHLVDDLISYRLMHDGAQLASKRLLPADAKPVRIELPGRTATRGADGRWTLAPDDPGISADALIALAANWTRAAATTVRVRKDGVVQAVVRIGLEGAATPIELELLTAVEGLRFARRDLGLEYELPAAARAELLELSRAVPAASAATSAAPPKK